MDFVDGDASRSRGSAVRRGRAYVAGSQGDFLDNGEIHDVRIVQARRGRSDYIQSEVMRTGEKWHWRTRTRDSGRKSHINFLVAHDRNGSAEGSYVVAIQPHMHRRGAEAGAKNLHRTDGLRCGAQGDFCGRAEVCRSGDCRVVDSGGQHAFDVDGLDSAKSKAGERAAAGVQREDQIVDRFHGDGSEDGDAWSGTGRSATQGRSRRGKAGDTALASSDDSGTLRDGWINQRDLVGLRIERDRGIGKGLEGHLCRTEFRKAGSRRTSLLGKQGHGADGLTLRIYKRNLAEGGVGVGEDRSSGNGIERDADNRRGDGVSQKWSSKAGFADSGAGAGIVWSGLEILKVSGVEDLADGKRPVEIAFSHGQSADEHSARIAWIEIVVLFRRNGDSVGGASGANNVCRAARGIGQVHGRKQARSSGSHVSQAGAGLEGNLRISPGIQCNEVDGAVGRLPWGNGVWKTLDSCVFVQIDDQPDVCGSKCHNRAMRKRIDAHGVWKRFRAGLAQGIALWNYAAEIHSCDRRASGNRQKG